MRTHLIVVMAVAVSTLLPAGARASAEHSCRQGDPPIAASARTSCALAGDIVTDYVNICHRSATCHMRVATPAAGKRYQIACRRSGGRATGTVLCTGSPGTGIWARFTADI